MRPKQSSAEIPNRSKAKGTSMFLKNFIDTANQYTNGTSEAFLGEFMKGHRESVVLGTKYTTAASGTDPNAAGNHRKSMMQSVEASLKRVQTDLIDIYL